MVAKYPSVALPIARRRHGIPVGDETELVIEAFPRSGMTFAVVAFEMAQTRQVRVACHVHAPAQVIEGARRRIPALVLVQPAEPATPARFDLLAAREGVYTVTFEPAAAGAATLGRLVVGGR